MPLEGLNKITELLGENVGFREEVEISCAVLLLHFADIDAQSIFPCDLITLGKVIDFLKLVEPLE